MGTGRLEAFSDGVIAVAITLLALTIVGPEPGARTLTHELLAQWPHYLAYLVSFASIGIIWVNHHATFRRLREVDHTILVLNLVLLATVVVLPFATDLLAQYLRRPAGRTAAAVVYTGCFGLMAIAFSALSRHILLDKAHLLSPPLSDAQRRRILRLGTAGLVPYIVAFGLAFVSADAALGVCAAIAAFYATPWATGVEVDGQPRVSDP